MGSVLSSLGGLFGKKPKAPKVAIPDPPSPVPRTELIDTSQKDRDRRRAKIQAAGRGGTILTQGQTLASGNATLLGRSNS